MIDQCTHTSYSLSNDGIVHFAKLKTHEASSLLQDSVCLLDHLIDMCTVANTKGNGVHIHRFIRDLIQMFSILDQETGLIGYMASKRSEWQITHTSKKKGALL